MQDPGPSLLLWLLQVLDVYFVLYKLAYLYSNNGHGLLLTPVEYPATQAISPSFATTWPIRLPKSAISLSLS